MDHIQEYEMKSRAPQKQVTMSLGPYINISISSKYFINNFSSTESTTTTNYTNYNNLTTTTTTTTKTTTTALEAGFATA